MASAAAAKPDPSGAATTQSGTSPVSYETFAPRSAAQISRLHRIAALTAGPTAQASSSTASTPQKDSSGKDAMSSSLLLQAMSPPSSISSLKYGSAITSGDDGGDSVQQTLAETLAASDQLTMMIKHTTSLRLALRASINIADDISNRHAELLRHSGELSAAAERLQAEEALLSRHAEEIGRPLQHYDAVDRIGILVGVLFRGRTVVRGLAKLKVDSDDFCSVLEDIDNAVDFFGKESGGKEALEEYLRKQHQDGQQQPHSGSLEYFRRSLALQEAALSLIREAVVDRIKQTTSDVAAALNIPKVPIAADKLEASLVYTRFHGISNRSNMLLTIVRKRLNRSEAYQELLTLCRNSYCSSREMLLKSTVRAHLDRLKDKHGLVGMTRLASVFLMRLCTVETSLYLDFFGDREQKASGNDVNNDNPTNGAHLKRSTSNTSASGSTPNPALATKEADEPEFQAYLGTLCTALHRTLRRGLVTVVDLDTLCQVVSVLREERTSASASPTTLAAARAVSSVIADAQERLIFCANAALQKDVIRFKATPADLNYPDKLRKQSSSGGGENATDAAEDAVQAQLKVYESWFPPMRSVLKILSKIFRVVEPRVFEDIALQSVHACTRCLKEGSAHILKTSGVMHADLFLVKHLLILREQLSPFDIQLRSVERQLDFSDAGKAVTRFLANRNRHLFSVSTENALLTLMREGVSVQDTSVDSKRDLEDSLRSACNDFIEHTCQSLAKPLMSFVEQCKVSAKSSAESLKAKAFMDGSAVKAMVVKTSEQLQVALGDVSTQMVLYLDNPATQSILLKPVIRKLSRAIEDVRGFIAQAVDGEFGWDAALRAEVLQMLSEAESIVKKANVKSSSTR